jgi:hypothetical protein
VCDAGQRRLLRGTKREVAAADAGAARSTENYKVKGCRNELGRWVKRAAETKEKISHVYSEGVRTGHREGDGECHGSARDGRKESEVRSNNRR